MADQLVRSFWQSRRTSAGLVERRALEPICTALLTHNNKLALQNCQKALRTKPYSPPVQTLFAICLARQGQLQDALAVAEEVAKDAKGAGKALADANMLCLCSWVFEQGDRREDALSMWELATRKHPANLDLVFEAIYYFVRIGAFRALEITCRTAIDLKHESHIPHRKAYEQLVWSYITAVVIQATDLSNSKSKCRISSSSSPVSTEAVYESLQATLLYFNADALTPAKRIRSDASVNVEPAVCTTPHTYYLLLKVLEYLASAPENVKVDSSAARSQLLEFLTTPQGIQFCQKDLQIDLLRRKIMIEHGSGQYSSLLLTAMKKKLSEGDTNWATIKTAIHAAYAIATRTNAIPAAETELDADSQEALPRNWWNSLEAESDESNGVGLLIDLKHQLELLGSDEGFSKKDRGLTLGLLKLATWFPGRPAPQLPDLIVLYLQRHANKACCFTDLKEYLAVLSEDGRQSVVSWLESKYGTGDIDVEDLGRLECSLTVEKLRRYLQVNYGTIDEEIESGHRLAKAYFDSLHFGKDLIVTDLQPNDEFALLAAQCYLGAWELSSKSSQYLELAIAMLEFATRRSKYRFQIRVLLIRLYQLAGAPSLALKHYKLMDIKQVQHDTLSHWALERGCTFFMSPDTGKEGALTGIDEELTSFPQALESANAWYSKADEETAYSVAQAWSSTSYYLLEDYTAFKDRLAYSLSRSALALDNFRIASLRTNIAGQSELAIRRLQGLVIDSDPNDNRDYSILPDHQPSGQESILKQTQSAPSVDARWIQTLASLYLAFLEASCPATSLFSEEILETERFTETEVRLLKWAHPVLPWLSGKEAKIDDALVLAFLKDCHAELMHSHINASLWHIYHTAQLALEAYCLLDVAFTAKSNAPGDFKNLKQFKQIRQDSRGSMKAISSRLKALNEDLSRKYKARNKLEAFQPLKQFEQVSEHFMLDVATQLLESRKAGLLQLANAITRRIAAN